MLSECEQEIFGINILNFKNYNVVKISIVVSATLEI